MSEYKKEEWRVKQPAADIRALAERFSISPILAHIIVNREITEPDAVACYLSDDLAYTHDPALMKDMDKGCQIMKEKIRAGKKIRIISDYDVDGITSNYILYQGLQKAGADVSYDIPHRIMDGYGMNVRLVEAAYADGVDTIITCDNGIAAETAVTRAKELGMTVIVTDHHEVPCEVTENGEKNYLYVNADAVIDPHRPDCAYSYKNLCGAGVAYKFIRHLYRVTELPWEDEDAYMDILALGTVCDIMPLTDENRIFVKRGLRRLTNSTNLGINALKKALGLDGKPIEVHHLSFRIGPSLNSTGRLESAKEGMELLLTDDPARAESLHPFPTPPADRRKGSQSSEETDPISPTSSANSRASASQASATRHTPKGSPTRLETARTSAAGTPSAAATAKNAAPSMFSTSAPAGAAPLRATLLETAVRSPGTANVGR